MIWKGEGCLRGKSGKMYHPGEQVPDGEITEERAQELAEKGKIELKKPAAKTPPPAPALPGPAGPKKAKAKAKKKKAKK